MLVTAFILFSAFRADKPFITIFTIGDSTMANKKLDGGNPERGWGMMLPGFFSEDDFIASLIILKAICQFFIAHLVNLRYAHRHEECHSSPLMKADFLFVRLREDAF